MAEEVVGIRLALRDRAATGRGLKDTTSDVEEIGDAAVRSTRKSRGLLDVMGKLGRGAARSAAVGIAGLSALGAAGIAAGVKVAAGNEQAKISFTTMLGSASRANTMIRDLQQFAAKTPFNFAGLQKSSASLISAGIEANKVIPIMTSLGNATSGMGTGSEGIARATVALQQMNAAGRITAEDFNQLQDATGAAYDLLAAGTGKSVVEITKLKDAGKLGRKELEGLMSALETGKGLDRFNGLMEKQSASLAGMWASFTDTVAMGLGRVLAPWGPTMKQALGEAQAAAGPLFDMLTEGSTQLAKRGPWAVRQIRDGIAAAVPFAQQMYVSVRGFVSQLRAGEGIDMGAARDLAGASAVLITNLPQLAAQMPSLNDAMRVGGVVVGFLADHLDTIAYFMPVLAAGFLLYRASIIASTAATIAEIPWKIADTAATWQLGNANRALAFQLSLATGQQVRSRTAIVLSTIAAGASKVATLASAAATNVASLATRGFGLALRFASGPVGWIITGLGLLAAGAVYAYKNFDWFRNSVQWVWQKLKDLWDIAKKVGSVIGDLFKYTPIGQIISVAKGDGLNVPTLPGRATGGPVTAGQPYVVGEREPEVFVPRQSGTVVKSVPEFEDMRGSLSGAVTVHNHVYLDNKQVTRSVIKGVRREQASR